METLASIFAIAGAVFTLATVGWSTCRIIEWVSHLNDVSRQTEYNRQYIIDKVDKVEHRWLKDRVEKLEQAARQ